jgi:copper homeostasis protein CutC
MLEVCCFSLVAALHAVTKCRAKRIELCSDRDLDGVSPDVREVRALLEINASRPPCDRFELIVMVRLPPAAQRKQDKEDLNLLGNSCGEEPMHECSEADLALLVAYIRSLPRIPSLAGGVVGVDGVVFGALLAGNKAGSYHRVDLHAVGIIAAAALECGIPGFTFHRAMDWVGLPRGYRVGENRNGNEDGEQRISRMGVDLAGLGKLGVERVLTSGLPGTPAVRSAAFLASLAAAASALQFPLRIMCGGGINPESLREMVRLLPPPRSRKKTDDGSRSSTAEEVSVDDHDTGPPLGEWLVDFHGSFLTVTDRDLPSVAAIQEAVAVLSTQS